MNGGGVHAWMTECHIHLVCIYRSGFCLSLRVGGGGGYMHPDEIWGGGGGVVQ